MTNATSEAAKAVVRRNTEEVQGGKISKFCRRLPRPYATAASFARCPYAGT